MARQRLLARGPGGGGGGAEDAGGGSRPTTLATVPAEQLPYVVPLVDDGEDICAACTTLLPASADGRVRGRRPRRRPRPAGRWRSIPKLVVAVRLDLTPRRGRAHGRARPAGGVKVFHLCADLHGCETRRRTQPRHIKDALREIHGRLVKDGMRDEITLIVGGGIALAEHMAKAIICGADLVARRHRPAGGPGLPRLPRSAGSDGTHGRRALARPGSRDASTAYAASAWST